MVQYLQNNFIMLSHTCYYEMDYSFYSFYWLNSLEIWLDHNFTYYRSLSKNSDVKRRISHCDPQNLQYETHPEFWPPHRWIFKMSLYYKTHLILETGRYHESYSYWKWLCWANFCTFHGTFKFLWLIGSEDQRYGSNFLRILAISLKFGRVMHSTMKQITGPTFARSTENFPW